MVAKSVDSMHTAGHDLNINRDYIPKPKVQLYKAGWANFYWAAERVSHVGSQKKCLTEWQNLSYIILDGVFL